MTRGRSEKQTGDCWSSLYQSYPCSLLLGDYFDSVPTRHCYCEIQSCGGKGDLPKTSEEAVVGKKKNTRAERVISWGHMTGRLTLPFAGTDSFLHDEHRGNWDQLRHCFTDAYPLAFWTKYFMCALGLILCGWFFVVHFFLLRQDLTMQTRLALNLCHAATSASQMLRLQMCITMPGCELTLAHSNSDVWNGVWSRLHWDKWQWTKDSSGYCSYSLDRME